MANCCDILIFIRRHCTANYLNIKIYVVLNVDGISWSTVHPAQLYMVVPGRTVYWLSMLALESDTNFTPAMLYTRFLKGEFFFNHTEPPFLYL